MILDEFFARFSSGLGFCTLFLFAEESMLFPSSNFLFWTCFAHLCFQTNCGSLRSVSQAYIPTRKTQAGRAASMASMVCTMIFAA